MAKLSHEAYTRFEIYFGRGKADEIAQQVRSGEMDADEAEEWSKEVEEEYERSSHNRRDVPPKYWQAWEDGDWP